MKKVTETGCLSSVPPSSGEPPAPKCRAAACFPQVKSNRAPSPAERETLAGFACPSNCKRLIHVWHDRQRWPEVREL